MAPEQDQWISDTIKREQSRLRHFIRRRVPDPRDVEDILQDVFSKLVEADRLLMPIDHVTGWLFRVARNAITDLFRKKTPESFSDIAAADEDDELLQLEDLLPASASGRSRFWGSCSSSPSAAESCSSCGIGCCRTSSAGARLPSGKRLAFSRCAGSSSADLDATVGLAPMSAVVWPIA